MDWNEIREEYIKDESCTYRKLSKKYGISTGALCRRSKEEGWLEQRERLKNKTAMKRLEKISEETAKQAAKRVKLYDDMVEKLGAKLREAIDVLNPNDANSVRRLTASLLEFKSLVGLKSDADAREQEARIKKLEHDCEKADADAGNDIEVTFAAGPEEWNE